MTMKTNNRAAMLMLTVAGLIFISAAGCQTSGGQSTALPALGALPEDANQVRPAEAGDRAPAAATVRDVNGRRVNLARTYRNGPTAMIFYRGGWCPFCTQHLAEFRAVERDLRDLGFQIIGVSPDRPAKLRESIGEHELTYSLLSDSDAELMRAFGVAFRVDDETNEMLMGYGIDVTDASGRSHRVLPVPAVYLIDTDGVIRFAHWDADYRRRISGDDVLRAAKDVVGQ